MHEVEHEVVLHCYLQSCQFLGWLSALADCCVDRVLALHELFVLLLDPVDHVWGVDIVAQFIPIDVLEESVIVGSRTYLWGSFVGVLVVVIEDRGKLTLSIFCIGTLGGHCQASKPVVCQFQVYCTGQRGGGLLCWAAAGESPAVLAVLKVLCCIRLLPNFCRIADIVRQK